MPEEGWRRKSGAAETLISHAGYCIRNTVHSLEFSYIKFVTSLLGCRRSCFMFVQTIRQPLFLTKSADGSIAKPRGC